MWWCKCKCLHSSCINELLVASSRTGHEAMHANAFGFHIIDKQQLYLQVLHTFHPNFPLQPRVCHALNHPAFEPHLFFDRIWFEYFCLNLETLRRCVTFTSMVNISEAYYLYPTYLYRMQHITKVNVLIHVFNQKYETSHPTAEIVYATRLVLYCAVFFLNLDPVLGPRMTWIWPWLFDQNFPPFGQRTDLLVAWCR